MPVLDLGPNRLRGSLNTKQLNRTALSLVTSNPISVSRTKHEIGYAVDAYYLIKFQIRGIAWGSNMAAKSILAPGIL